ncbi:hypothetical protein BHU16_10920 [Tannerella sp. oral taxon 808]|nr:hypothetical protein BHU16_10920 [Tannerella sp. oral taxon 808]
MAFLKQEREYQHAPGIEKTLEDVIGGGTVDRSDMAGALFAGKPLDELPPFAPVVKDEATGACHVVKTARIYEAASAAKYKVQKKHLFTVGDAVTLGGDYTRASDVIKDIDKSDPKFDVITLAATIGSASEGDVLVQAKDKQAAGSAVPKYGSKAAEICLTMSPIDLTVANGSCGLLVMGTVTEAAMLLPLDAALKAHTRIHFV